MQRTDSILIGNSFPLSLVRRGVRIIPVPLSQLQESSAGAEVCSFWGHANTLPAAEAFSGLTLAPGVERPVIALSSDGLPVLEGREFHSCWILSPDYHGTFRPAVGEEVSPEKISGWQILKITWE